METNLKCKNFKYNFFFLNKNLNHNLPSQIKTNFIYKKFLIKFLEKKIPRFKIRFSIDLESTRTIFCKTQEFQNLKIFKFKFQRFQNIKNKIQNFKNKN